MPAHRGTGSHGRQVRGRRLLNPEGGNRGVVAQDSVLLPCYGDCNFALGWR
jgi:ABC-type taurine transport system ATPase subunit